MRSDDEGIAPGEEKLIPEWSVDADDQIIVLGLAVLAAFLAIFGWNTLTGDDEPDTALDTAAEVVAGPAVLAPALGTNITVPSDVDSADEAAIDAGAADDNSAADTTEAPATTAAPTTRAPTTTTPTTIAAPIDLAPDVAASISGFSGAASTVDGTAAILTGFVGTDADKAAAGSDAAAVTGITSVDNQLVVLQPDVETALAANVADAAVEMNDTIATVRGEVPDDAARTAAVTAAGAVPGVASVVDELTVPETAVVAQLNDLFELEPIQFGTGSATILDASFGTLDQAVAILGDNTTAIDIQGYTDVRGPEVANLTLSQARADAVLAYLVDNGVDGENLQSTGYGETTEFGDGDSADALAANRRVRFELI